MKIRCLFVWLLLAVPAFGQTDSSDATARLKERQAARLAERARPVTITQGELDDLRALVVRLQAENTALKAETAKAAVKAKPAAEVAPGDLVKSVTLGMAERDLVRAYKLKPISKTVGTDQSNSAHYMTTYRLSNSATVSCEGGRVMVFGLEPVVGMDEAEFIHFNQRANGSEPPIMLYGVVYDSRSQKEYHNASHTVTVDKVSKKIAAVAIP
jgi:hypothetical protein